MKNLAKSASTQQTTAAQLPSGKIATIVDIEKSPFALILLSMGCLPGQSIRLVRKNWDFQSYYFHIGKQFVALRKNEAAQITVSY